jgi:hypothetical protein
VFPAVLLAIVLQSGWLHLAIGAVLGWNTVLPSWNPFEVAYNRWIAPRRGHAPLSPAPGPRRLAQGLAAAFNLASGVGLLYGLPGLAWVAEVLLVVGFSALLFGKLCLGAYAFHLLAGRAAFANATLPWGKGPAPTDPTAPLGSGRHEPSSSEGGVSAGPCRGRGEPSRSGQ